MRALALAALMAWPASAQDAETLADIRQQLSVLNAEVTGLSRELQTTGAAGLGIEGTTYPERVVALEEALRRLTAQTEELSFRIEGVARDGGNRIEDLRFQLCELTPDCDLAALPQPGALGGDEAAAPAAPAPAPAAPGPQLAMGEQAELDAAIGMLDGGDAAGAAAALERFVATYPTGPLTGRAQLARGAALAASGDQAAAARAYLEAFSGAPDGPQAPAALMGLGRSLAALGQTDEACLTLSEVPIRFPQAPEAGAATSARAELGCL
jgi:tol-pal system protein YbgF